MQDSSLSHAPTSVRSFIDLRAFADQLSDMFAATDGNDAFLSSRHLLPLAEGPVTAGIVRLSPGEGQVAAIPADEFMIVHEGALTLKSDAKEINLIPGMSVMLTEGVSITWSTDTSATLIFMRRTGGPAGTGALIPIDENAPLEASGAPSAELLVGPTPDCRNHSDYRSADGEFVCGTWDSTPYHRRSMLYRHFELMHLTQGAVTFQDEAGRRRTFVQGDIFLIEQNAHCSWESREHVKKVYAIYRPA